MYSFDGGKLFKDSPLGKLIAGKSNVTEKTIPDPNKTRIICRNCKTVINQNKAFETHMKVHKNCFAYDAQ